MRLGRFWFSPFWQITRWGFMWREKYFLPTLSCDEWHNKSFFIILPLVGEFGFFKKPYLTDGPIHLWGYGNNKWEGSFIAACDICQEMADSLIDEGYELPSYWEVLTRVTEND